MQKELQSILTNKEKILKKYIEICRKNCEMAKNIFNSSQQLAYMLMGLLNSEKTQYDFLNLTECK